MPNAVIYVTQAEHDALVAAGKLKPEATYAIIPDSLASATAMERRVTMEGRARGSQH